MTDSPPPEEFTSEQKEYLQGFAAGLAAAGALPFVGQNGAGLITASPDAAAGANLAAPPPEDTVYGTPLSDLCKEERIKYEENPLDLWEKLVAHANDDAFPTGGDVFRFKYHGLFYVAPNQDSFMLRLRIPACELNAHQMRGLAGLAADYGGGYAHVTTRGNIQIREFRPKDIITVLTRIQELGLTSRGAGADNVRNITASPNSGFDPDELYDVRPLAKGLHHYILNNRDLYGLPRKFNVAFDNGGSLSVAADTNDIGVFACRVTEQSLAKAGGELPDVEPGVYFRIALGGVTGHQTFAQDAGILIRPSECVAVCAAMIRVFNENGDRTNRKRARLKYLIEKWGIETFIEKTQEKLAFTLTKLPAAACESRRPVLKHGWTGIYKQSQPGLNSIGIGIPVGRMSAKQMRQLADLADHVGKGELRLTVWQNIIIPHISDSLVDPTKRSLQRIGFYCDPSSVSGGVVACTGNFGCKYSSTDTKTHAVAISRHLEKAVPLESPINIHVTGCPHSCAQHYCGDIGLLGTKLADGSEGYHIVLGGGMDNEQGVAREIFRSISIKEAPTLLEGVLRTYKKHKSSGETFVQWTRRHNVGELQELFAG